VPKRRDFWNQRARPKSKKKPPGQSLYFLDQFSLGDIKEWARRRDKFLAYHWEYYSCLAYQRSQILDQFKSELRKISSGPWPFSKWQRAVKYKYSLEPLSARGSLVDPGGRFNVGDIDPLKFSPFPALYLAQDRDTAMQELLCQQDIPSEISPHELALLKPDSISLVSISGSLDQVIRLEDPDKFADFVKIFQNFRIPNHIAAMAREIGFLVPAVIRDGQELLFYLLEPNWRLTPMQFDVLAPCQIFGQLAMEAGIEGIIYLSKFTGKECVAVFPGNFGASDSFVQLDDEAPAEAKLRRLDSSNWQGAML